MTAKLLFSLENCIKCTQTKQVLKNCEDVEIITFPHEIAMWTEEQKEFAKNHDVFEDLQKTAPILWINGEKTIGYLRIRKWVQDNTISS